MFIFTIMVNLTAQYDCRIKSRADNCSYCLGYRPLGIQSDKISLGAAFYRAESSVFLYTDLQSSCNF